MQLGIDLGGTKIAAIVLDRDGRAVWESRALTPRDDYDGTLRAIATLVAAGEAAAGRPCTVGVGTPGAVSPATGVIKNANSTWLNGRSFDADLGQRLGRSVRTANDANCLAMSEAADGAAAGARVVFGAIVGTGVGGGIVVDGRPLVGPNAIAGEWGHNPLPWPADEERPGPACYCGRKGCLETFLSGPGLHADYVRRCGVARGHGSEMVAALVSAGDACAAGTMVVWFDRLARALASVINVLDPDVIVLGGGLSQIGGLYTEVPRLWTRWVFSDIVATRLVPARFGDASGVRGAARLWPAESC
ncbi:MAG TPA: ROK family protein [Vicinamibacterales bacterium]|nr:ROK family protein [Vicinamibacterales bacterium]